MEARPASCTKLVAGYRQGSARISFIGIRRRHLAVGRVDPFDTCSQLGLVGRIEFDDQYGAARETGRPDDPAACLGVDGCITTEESTSDVMSAHRRPASEAAKRGGLTAAADRASSRCKREMPSRSSFSAAR